ncbi:MAG: peroxiredoxin-like family protein [Halodesulfovibrio sp.]
MTLTQQLADQKAQSTARIPDAARKIMSAELSLLIESHMVENAPKVGDTIKTFTLPNQNGEAKSLSSFLGNGPVVITFYRGGWCPYCNIELRAYQAALPEITAQGATLIAITPEQPDNSLSTAEKNALAFDVLSDINSDYAREIGIVFSVSDELRTVYSGFGIDLDKHNGQGRYDLPLAATFVIDTNGTVTWAFVNEDYTLRADPVDVVNALKALP